MLYKAVVFSNTVQSLLAIVKAMNQLSIAYENETTAKTAESFILYIEGNNSGILFKLLKHVMCYNIMSYTATV